LSFPPLSPPPLGRHPAPPTAPPSTRRGRPINGPGLVAWRGRSAPPPHAGRRRSRASPLGCPTAGEEPPTPACTCHSLTPLHASLASHRTLVVESLYKLTHGGRPQQGRRRAWCLVRACGAARPLCGAHRLRVVWCGESGCLSHGGASARRAAPRGRSLRGDEFYRGSACSRVAPRSYLIEFTDGRVPFDRARAQLYA